MKNEYQVSERNAIVEDHLWCIDSVIRQNYTLIKAARLDLDDVYQTLALRLIRAVAGYNPEKGILRQHIFAQLQYELLSCKSARALYGFTYAPLICGAPLCLLKRWRKPVWIGNPKLQRDAGTDMEEIAVLFHRLLCVSPKGKYPDAQVFMKIK